MGVQSGSPQDEPLSFTDCLEQKAMLATGSRGTAPISYLVEFELEALPIKDYRK